MSEQTINLIFEIDYLFDDVNLNLYCLSLTEILQALGVISTHKTELNFNKDCLSSYHTAIGPQIHNNN